MKKTKLFKNNTHFTIELYLLITILYKHAYFNYKLYLTTLKKK